MKVWIDQELCTGAAICETNAPEVFHMADDGLAYVKEGDKVLDAGEAGKAVVPEELEETVRDTVDECPAECIFIEG